MPKITPPEFVIIGLLLGAMATYYAIKSFDDYMNDHAARVQMNTLLEIMRQCNSKYPLMLNSELYTCKKLPYKLR